MVNKTVKTFLKTVVFFSQEGDSIIFPGNTSMNRQRNEFVILMELCKLHFSLQSTSSATSFPVGPSKENRKLQKKKIPISHIEILLFSWRFQRNQTTNISRPDYLF